MNNLLPYCGSVDAKIRASDKDLPVPQFSIEWSHMEKYLEDRKNAHLKKRLDASIRAKMLPILSSFVSSTDIQVFVLPFQGTVVPNG